MVPPAGSGLWLAAPAGGSPPSGAPADDAPPGAPVAVGPADAPVGHVRDATRALAGLVAAGGPLAAGAGADLGHGFFSARLDGGRGDRRDCLLAALRARFEALS